MRKKTSCSIIAIALASCLVLVARANADQQFKTDEGYTISLSDDWVEVPSQVL